MVQVNYFEKASYAGDLRARLIDHLWVLHRHLNKIINARHLFFIYWLEIVEKNIKKREEGVNVGAQPKSVHYGARSSLFVFVNLFEVIWSFHYFVIITQYNLYSRDRFNRYFLLWLLFWLGFISVVIGWTEL
jgi:hypothetical protein